MAGDALELPEWLASGRGSGALDGMAVLDARRMGSRSHGMIGRFGIGAKSVLTLPTGTGKTRTFVATAVEAAQQRRRLTVVVKDRYKVAEFKAELEAAWGGLGTAGDNLTAPGSFPLNPEPYVLRRLRARTDPVAAYRALCRRAVEWEATGRDQERRAVSGDQRGRNRAATRAVIIRSRGQCESPECLLPKLPYRTTAGEPLLEADHIDDHAGGGRDHPAAMIALCPNCHANKTRGAGQAELTERLR